MGVTVQVRDLDPAVQETLKAQASAQGLSLSEYLRRTLSDIAERIQVHERWERAVAEDELRMSQPEKQRWQPIHVDRDVILETIQEGREER
ncbi:FitA-like ribbon-helix-helix domain-containing protein [Cryobacterium tepidiphilum]|jgi:hypothetical protein|uniref:Antitoxin FitA-like ribbon-helix-helix domain-containing protein n=1 Tax=Cryobacterium tepidiphilum TaxID=2486026 RepID=A0A3M8LPV0_9MICO|nr:hypothetical protein [Cryobacterium tepidiphilum]RNE67401.1 hypothetical protein EEJ31_01135 [Cryobacterium tepidiphilum]